MRRAGFWLGLALAVIAAATLVAQAMAWLAGAGLVSLGTLWARIDANSLVGLQALVEQLLSPSLWPPVLQLLLAPAWLVFGLLAGLLLVLCRPRRRGLD